MDSLSSAEPLTGCMNNSLRAKGKTHAMGSVKYHSLALMPSMLPYCYYILLFSDLPYMFLPFRENLAVIVNN